MHQPNNAPSVSHEPLPEPFSNLDITTFSYEERRIILPAVTEALEHCGCWLLDRKPTSFTQMEYNFELHAYAVVDLYAALIAAGLELTRASHQDLTMLCAVRRHDVRPSTLPSLLTVRLLVSFVEDLTAGLVGKGAVATA